METPQYIKSLLIPNGKKPVGKKVWSIDLETVWLPFFVSTNVMRETAINPDALGAPLRLAYNSDGSVKFSKIGRPVTKVAKELSDNIRMVRENFTANLLAYANGVITENPEAYKLHIEFARGAGEPILDRDRENLEQALAEIRERELAEAMAQAEAIAKAKPKKKGKAKVKEPEPIAEVKPEPIEPEPELVGVTS